MADNPFTDEERDLFNAEGWDIFEASGSIQNKDGDREFQLQRLDEDDILPDDTTAWRLVWTKARAGSTPHQKALNFLREHSPGEFNAIQEEATTTAAVEFVERMASFTLPEEETEGDVDDFIADLDEERLYGEYHSFMEMIREARKIRA